MQATHQLQPYDAASRRPPSEIEPRSASEALREGVARRVNVNGAERAASLLAGGFMLARSGKRSGKLLALLGSALVYRGISGHCHLYQALGLTTAARS